MKAISLLLPSPDCPFDAVCFHAQQAAEKYLKGLLFYLRVPFPKIHDVEELLDLLPEGTSLDLNMDDLSILSQWAVFPRYPDFEEELQRTDADTALEIAEKVKAAVLEEMSRRGLDMSLLNRPTQTEEET